MNFKKITFLEKVARFISSEYREKKDKERKEAIRWLVNNPDESCNIAGVVIEDGYGNERTLGD